MIMMLLSLQHWRRANAVIPQQPSRRREGDRHQTPQQRTTTHGGAGRGRGGGTGRGRGG